MTRESKITEIEFPCPYSVEDKYDFVTSGEYGVFEVYDAQGEVNSYRGYRKGYGLTGTYDNFKDALEASFTEFAHKENANDIRTSGREDPDTPQPYDNDNGDN